MAIRIPFNIRNTRPPGRYGPRPDSVYRTALLFTLTNLSVDWLKYQQVKDEFYGTLIKLKLYGFNDGK